MQCTIPYQRFHFSLYQQLKSLRQFFNAAKNECHISSEHFSRITRTIKGNQGRVRKKDLTVHKSPLRIYRSLNAARGLKDIEAHRNTNRMKLNRLLHADRYRTGNVLLEISLLVSEKGKKEILKIASCNLDRSHSKILPPRSNRQSRLGECAGRTTEAAQTKMEIRAFYELARPRQWTREPWKSDDSIFAAPRHASPFQFSYS